MEPVKKKRGRKPKNKIIINENPKFEQDKIENLISTLNIKKEKEKEIELNDLSYTAFENNDFSTVNAIENEEKICWNCCHCINKNISLPINYINGIFHLNGNFCSYGCAGRYIFDNYHGKDLFDKYSLLNLYHNINNNTCEKIKISPEKIKLKKFGGDMEYEDYIKKSDIYNIQNSYIPPSIYISHQFSNKDNKGENNFKMYRKKDIKVNTIFKDIENQEKI